MSFLWTDMDDFHILLLIILGIIIVVVAVLVLLLIYCGKKLKRRRKTKIVTEKVSKNQIPLLPLNEDIKLNEWVTYEDEHSKKIISASKEIGLQTETIKTNTVGTITEVLSNSIYGPCICRIKKESKGKVINFPTPKGNGNLGNTCFFNSSLQALYFSKSFKEALVCTEHVTRDFDNMVLTKSVLELLEKQTKLSENHTKELQSVLSAVRRINNQFGRGTQEDSYELLNTLLSGIFDEINNSDNSKLITERDESLMDVRNIFKGMFIEVYVYDSCNDIEIEFEEFTTLSIPIVDQSKDSCNAMLHYGFRTVTADFPRSGIENGLASLTQIEEFEDLPCRICNTNGMEVGKSYKKMLVFQPPPVLIIHIDRYNMRDLSHLTKNCTQMSYHKRLDMSQFCSVANNTMSKQDFMYELYAVVVHTGAICGGHYYAFVNTARKHDVKRWERLVRKSTGDIDTLKRNAEIILKEKRNGMKQERPQEIPEVEPNWYYVSDQTVTSVSEKEVLSHKDAYILFYEVQ